MGFGFVKEVKAPADLDGLGRGCTRKRDGYRNWGVTYVPSDHGELHRYRNVRCLDYLSVAL